MNKEMINLILECVEDKIKRISGDKTKYPEMEEMRLLVRLDDASNFLNGLLIKINDPAKIQKTTG